jgi:large subunit ribosomal protein L3
MEGMLGKKIGMTQVYDAEGRKVAVTVVEAGPCPIVQVKTPETDGYSAAQLGFNESKPVNYKRNEEAAKAAEADAAKRKEAGKADPAYDVAGYMRRMTRAEVFHCAKAGVKPCRTLKEFALDEGESVKEGDFVTVKIFEGVKMLDVRGFTKGKGFMGVVRRYRMQGGPMTHGGHSKRRIGSIGARDLPGWVHKGKRMPGHMGAVNRTCKNLTLVQVRGQDNLLLIQGSVPGPIGGTLIITKAQKQK